METGYDILFFWVARMMMMGLHFMGEVPFRRVLLHGLVVDERGEKMSKVKGNVIDPLDVIGGADVRRSVVRKARPERAARRRPASSTRRRPVTAEGFPPYGADALRMTLLSYSPQQQAHRARAKRIEGYRKFANKLWNASRFALMSLEGSDARATRTPPEANELREPLDPLAPRPRARRRRQGPRRTTASTTPPAPSTTSSGTSSATGTSSSRSACSRRNDAAIVAETRATLVHALETTLRALHPMMPFITEEIWQRLPKSDDAGATIMLARYPTRERDARDDDAAEREVAVVQKAVSQTRTIRAEHDVPWAEKLDLELWAGDAAAVEALERNRAAIETLTNATFRSHVTHGSVTGFGPDWPSSEKDGVGAAIGLPPEIAAQSRIKERSRLERELKKVQKELDACHAKLMNPSFLERAPANVVDAEEKRLQMLIGSRASILAALDQLAAVHDD